jgi:hypothetical protein
VVSFYFFLRVQEKTLDFSTLDGKITALSWNFGNRLPSAAVSHPRRSENLVTPLRNPQTLQSALFIYLFIYSFIHSFIYSVTYCFHMSWDLRGQLQGQPMCMNKGNVYGWYSCVYWSVMWVNLLD